MIHDMVVVAHREVVDGARPELVREVEPPEVLTLDAQHVAPGLRRQHLLPDGPEVAQSAPGLGKLEVTRNSRFAHGQFFRNRYQYQVILRVKRTSNDYQTVWSEPTTPGNTPSTPPSAQLGASSGGGGCGKRHR